MQLHLANDPSWWVKKKEETKEDEEWIIVEEPVLIPVYETVDKPQDYSEEDLNKDLMIDGTYWIMTPLLWPVSYFKVDPFTLVYMICIVILLARY